LLLSNYEILDLFVSPHFNDGYRSQIEGFAGELTVVKPADLQGLGLFKSSREALAIARCNPNVKFEILRGEYALALDRIRDPGNLGTILRIADWYGITKIVCSKDCAELYNPKVIQSSMGSFTRTMTFYTDLLDFLDTKIPVYGAFLDGTDVHQTHFKEHGIIVIGNESQGIDRQLQSRIDSKITIPKYGKAESLNAAIATAVICDALRTKIG